MKSKKIALETVDNCRDLGGMATRDGYRIREHMLLRSNGLFEASKGDMRRLYDEYGLRTIIDLRNAVESYQKPDPEYEGIVYIENCVQNNEFFGVTRDEESVRRMKEFFAELDAKFANDPSIAGPHMESFYRELLEDYGVMAYGRFLHRLLEADGAVLWHCSLGKDRCGVATALVLEILGVDREDIIEDYLYTNRCLYGTDDPPYTPAGFLNYAHRSYIEAYYAEAERLYGTMDNLLKKMGIDEAEKAAFRNRYLVL